MSTTTSDLSEVDFGQEPLYAHVPAKRIVPEEPVTVCLAIAVRAGGKEQQYGRFNEQRAARLLLAGHTRAGLADEVRSRCVGLIGCDLVQTTGFSPAPSAGTGTLEDRACLVSGRTDSITR